MQTESRKSTGPKMCHKVKPLWQKFSDKYHEAGICKELKCCKKTITAKCMTDRWNTERKDRRTPLLRSEDMQQQLILLLFY